MTSLPRPSLSPFHLHSSSSSFLPQAHTLRSFLNFFPLSLSLSLSSLSRLATWDSYIPNKNKEERQDGIASHGIQRSTLISVALSLSLSNSLPRQSVSLSVSQ